MIRLEGATAREAPLALRPTSFALGPGVHAIVGAREDSAALVLALIAGRARLRGGLVRVLDRPPSDAMTRRALAYVPMDARLPEAMRAGEALALAAAVRGEAAGDPAERLAALGLASLASRKVWSLSREEARGVAMAEALTSSVVQVILLEEPYVAIDPRAAAFLAGRVASRAREGACVVFATSSPRDAIELADTQLVFDKGAMVRHVDVLDPIAGAARGASLRVVSSDPRALLAALAAEPAVFAVEAKDTMILLGGMDVLELARAVARSALAAGVEIHELRREAVPLDEHRAAASGAATAAYHAAYEKARAAMAQPPRRPSP